MLTRDPVPLPDDAVDDVKAYLRIDTPDDDALIAALAATAVTRAESLCGQMLIQRNVVERVSARGDWQRLSELPVIAIAQVNMVGTLTTPLAPNQFAVDIDSEARGWVRVTDATVIGSISVHYAAGLASSWDTLPETIRHAIIRLVSYLCTSRDAAVDAGPPTVVAALLRPYRRMRLS
jgi:uncharacterized phiE125 gp8 family phage protein